MDFLRDYFKAFVQKRLFLKAAALSYTSVLTLLPLIAICFAATNFLLTQADPEQIDRILEMVLNRMVPQVELLDSPIQYGPDRKMLTKREIKDGIKTIIGRVGSGQVGLVGGSTFIFLAVSLLLTIEHSLNDIWDVSFGRSFLTRFTLYLTIIILGSIFFLLTIILTTRWQSSRIVQEFQSVPLLPSLIQFLLPFVLCWLGLSLLYGVLPNTKVSFVGALSGGIVGGTLLQLNTMLSFVYLFNVATATRLYGRLGIIPIFLAGLYISWLIVLAGAQFTRTFETYRTTFPR